MSHNTKLMNTTDFTNSTDKLRIGYAVADGPQLAGGLDVILKGFDIEFVCIPDYYPNTRNSNGK